MGHRRTTLHISTNRAPSGRAAKKPEQSDKCIMCSRERE